MKKCVLILGMVFALMLGDLFAQPPGDIDAIRVGYITRKLNLSVDEAKTFWPVYDAYRMEMKSLREEQRNTAKSTRENFDTMSDKEVEASIENMLANRRKELDITLKYHDEFKKVLPIRKVAKLYKAEMEFTQLLLDRLQGGGRPGGPGGPDGDQRGGPGGRGGMRRF
jgi:hypothetical protein